MIFENNIAGFLLGGYDGERAYFYHLDHKHDSFGHEMYKIRSLSTKGNDCGAIVDSKYTQFDCVLFSMEVNIRFRAIFVYVICQDNFHPCIRLIGDLARNTDLHFAPTLF